MKQAIEILRNFSEGGTPEHDLDFGLCWHVKEYKGMCLYPIFQEWDEFSGYLSYPVHTSSDQSAEAQYNHTINMWVGEYGDARRRLCKFLVEELEKLGAEFYPVKLSIVFDEEIPEGAEIDLGSVYINLHGRECRWDIVQSYRKGDTIHADLEVDAEIFPDCDYDLTIDDLIGEKHTAKTVYVETELDIKHATLFVKRGTCTRAINLELE